MVEILDSIRQIKTNAGPYKKWVKQQDDIEARRIKAYQLYPANQQELFNASGYGKAIVDSVNIMDDYSEKKAEDVEAATQSIAGFAPIAGLAAGGLGTIGLIKSKTVAKFVDNVITKSPKLGSVLSSTILFGPAAVGVFSAIIASSIYATTLQKNASRIARFQARKTELKDPKNFVNYTPEQLEQARTIAGQMPLEQKKEHHPANPIANMGEVFTTIKSLIKDRKAYAQWKKENALIEQEDLKLFNLNITPEQLAKAKADQDVIARVIKKIDIASQEYSENVEAATNTLVGTTLAGGGFAGFIVSKAIKLLEKAKMIPANNPIVAKAKMFAIPAVAIASLLTASVYAAKIQKEAARVGRYKAKNDLMADPHNFIYYSNEQLQSVQPDKQNNTSVNPVKKFFNDIIDDIKFIASAKKDFKEYAQYKKSTALEEENLRKALRQVQVSPQQLEEASQLQGKVFKMFDKMDEMSQRYAEDVEAVTQILQQSVPQLFAWTTGITTAGLLTSKIGKNLNPVSAAMLGVIPMMIPVFAVEFFSTKVEKYASKIGLMKAIKDLEDPRHFVEYTEEQKKQAQAFQGNNPVYNNTSNDFQSFKINKENYQAHLTPVTKSEELITPPVLYQATSTPGESVNNWLNSLNRNV